MTFCCSACASSTSPRRQIQEKMFSQIGPVQLFCLSVRPNYIFFIASSILGIEKTHDDIINGAVQAVREHLGPVVAFKSAVIVPQLPKVNSFSSF